jgi:hypothetical protein
MFLHYKFQDFHIWFDTCRLICIKFFIHQSPVTP